VAGAGSRPVSPPGRLPPSVPNIDGSPADRAASGRLPCPRIPTIASAFDLLLSDRNVDPDPRRTVPIWVCPSPGSGRRFPEFAARDAKTCLGCR